MIVDALLVLYRSAN